MSARLLSRDPSTGILTYCEKVGRDHMRIITVHDCKPTVELNKRRQREATERGVSNEFRMVASIPIGVQYKWMRDYGVDIHNKDHMPKVKRLLKDPEYRYLATAPRTRQDFVALRRPAA